MNTDPQKETKLTKVTPAASTGPAGEASASPHLARAASTPVSGSSSSVARAASTSFPSLPSVQFSIPSPDLAEFARLPETVRDDVRRTLSCLTCIAAAPSVAAGCRSQSALMHGARGFTELSLRRKYYAFLQSGSDWHTLIDRARAGADFIDRLGTADGRSGELPDAFIDFWRGLCERNQRKTKPAHRELLRIWRTHHDTRGCHYKAIPGYSQWPSPGGTSSASPHLARAASTTGGTSSASPHYGPSGVARTSFPSLSSVPCGWSLANLYRYAPTKFELTAARVGRGAASAHRLQVFTTRVGLRVGQYFLFDDQEYDAKINYPGTLRAMRPLGLNALDLFSACLFAYGFKPTLWNQEESAKEKLKLRDMLWFVVHVLTQFGYRDDDRGTTFVVEHGTAAISEDFERRIFDATHGRVKVQRSGLQGAPSFDGLFEGQSRGNFRFKAALESIFNLVRNEMAMLPGQVGKDRLHCPEELHGRDRYNTSLLKAALALPPETAQLLRLPFMTWDQFTGLCLEVYTRINARTDHDLEGWDKAGLVVSEWCLPMARAASTLPVGPSIGGTSSRESLELNHVNPVNPVWLPQSAFLSLPAPEQSIMRQLIEANPSCTRARKLAPIEVFDAGRRELMRVPDFLIPVLLGNEFGVERTVRDNLFTIDDGPTGESLGPGPHRFVARTGGTSSASPKHGDVLVEGERYLTFINPYAPNALIVCDAAGRYIGTCPRWNAPCRSDVDAIHRQMGTVKQIEAQLLAPVARRGADLAREKLDMHRHNAAVLRDHVTPPQERAMQRQIAAQRADILEAFPSDCPDRPSEGTETPTYAVTEEELNQL